MAPMGCHLGKHSFKMANLHPLLDRSCMILSIVPRAEVGSTRVLLELGHPR